MECSSVQVLCETEPTPACASVTLVPFAFK